MAGPAEREEHLKNLADGYAYAFGLLNYFVGAFLEGRITEDDLRSRHAELTADLETAKGTSRG